ncbi:hypothetical protein FDENT_1343 [Fusarium denticulatum]|uniref:CBM-cenC domain-containing protein n=1 Tax=Fusarium denticulatum TaxID=48507 RepID=A0A8H5XIB3_9HYPO|nr:hypothetical protein FDENT_1343 [Fusarium denticulatum]
MKFTSSVFQLLALCQIASASPCKPSSVFISTASASTTEASQTESSTGFIHETTDTATTDHETLSGSSTIATSIATSSAEAETTTTTTAASGPTNLISNPGFEDSTVEPWTIYNNVGALSIASGSGIPPSPQAGQFSASGENLSNMGIIQNLDSSLVVVDQEYRFSVYTKVTASNFCISQTIACGAGTGFVNSANWGAMQPNGWILTTSRQDIEIVVMRLTYPFIQLLALYKVTSASPCKPSSQTANSTTSIRASSSGDAEMISTDILSTTTLTTESATFMTLSSSVLSATTESVTSTAVLSSASVTETESSTIASSETTTIAESTTTYEPSISTTFATTSIETSTDETPTTTTSVKQQPTNLIRNPGFEDPTFAPWEAEKNGNRGWLSVRSDTSRPGSFQSGVFDSSTPPTGGLRRRLIQPYTWSVKQDIDPSKIIVGKEYRFSIFQKTTASIGCTVQRLGCSAGSASAGSGEFGGPLNTWALGAVSCTWNEAQLDAGPSVYVNIICGAVTFFLDDAVLIEREASLY